MAGLPPGRSRQGRHRGLRRARSLLILTASLLLLLTLTAGPTNASAQTHLVLIMAPADEAGTTRYTDLQLAVWAHLSARPVKVQVLGIDGPIDADAARQQWAATEALAVAWLADDARQFRWLIPDLDPEPRSRAIPGEEEEWVSRCEVMATVLHADVEQRLAELLDAPVEPPPPPPPEEPTRTPVWFVAGVGYAPALLSTGGPFRQGLGIAAGLQIGPHLGFRAGADIVQSTTAEVPDEEAWLSRVPIRLEGFGIVPIGILDLGGTLGAVVEISDWHLSYVAEDERANVPHTALGLTGAAHVRLRVLPWLAPFLLAGGDFYFVDLEWGLRDSGVQLRRDPVMLRLTVGISVLVGPR